MDFASLGLSSSVLQAIQDLGFKEPTPIQAQAIPIALSGKDIIGSAQTGTGKTAAFALPILQHLGKPGKLRALILEPTRELADQVSEALKKFSQHTGLRVGLVYGGVGYGAQREQIQRGIDILVATPGRLLDLVGQGDLHFSQLTHLVLDEVDRMLDMGFLPDVKRIVSLCPANRQTLFFSATIPPEIERLTQWALKDPVTVEIGLRQSAAETVTHALYPVAADQKHELLLGLLEKTHYESVIVFCRTRMGSDRVAGSLSNLPHPVGVLHSDRSQTERGEALAGFRSGKYPILVATDIAARGLDIAGVTHVINYDVPQHPEDYVHRIGRTGRAAKEGDALTLFVAEELPHVEAIERMLGQKLPRKKLENFPYRYT
ncbi:MAG: DEAD/DEAH box helicase, partial [Verrucomicrobia bacterium]|nr:DEAD/DEAH box helicase [Verrucomicrobiota bacterium]